MRIRTTREPLIELSGNEAKDFLRWFTRGKRGFLRGVASSDPMLVFMEGRPYTLFSVKGHEDFIETSLNGAYYARSDLAIDT